MTPRLAAVEIARRRRRHPSTWSIVPVACAAALGAAAMQPARVHDAGLPERVRALTVAVIHGDGPAVAVAADWIARHTVPDAQARAAAGAGGAGAIERLSLSLGTASGVDATAAATAALLSACADCHQAAGAAPALPRPTPAGTRGIAGHMTGHQLAADLMLEGMLSPSAEAWTRGARQLRQSPLRAADFPVSTRIGGLMAAAEARLHEMAGSAAAAPDREARTAIYATLLTRCAECHTRHTSLWDTPRK